MHVVLCVNVTKHLLFTVVCLLLEDWGNLRLYVMSSLTLEIPVCILFCLHDDLWILSVRRALISACQSTPHLRAPVTEFTHLLKTQAVVRTPTMSRQRRPLTMS